MAEDTGRTDRDGANGGQVAGQHCTIAFENINSLRHFNPALS
jgi:hypothetical protein